MADSVKDIASDVASRMLNRGDDLQKALRDIGYGHLWQHTRAAEMDEGDLLDKSWHPGQNNMADLEKALIPVLTKAMARSKTGSEDLESAWGKVAFEPGTQYKTLNDAVAGTGDPKYGPGHTQVWYMKPATFRNLIMGYDFVAEHVPQALPDPRNLHKTHVLVGVLNVTSPGQIYHQMQGEMWSPHGEARSMIQGLGLQHTSMSIGDIIVEGSDVLMVDTHGFKKLGRKGA